MPAPDREQFSQTILQQSDKLQHLVERLLLLAKIEQPTFKLSLEPCDVAELLQRTMTNQQAWQQQKQLACQYLGDTAITVTVDKFWLSQALQNLLDNAIKFANQGVLLTAFTTAEQLIIHVVNDNTLVPDYVLTKAFERYFSLSPSIASDLKTSQTQFPTPKGTGLGLTLAQQVIERHQGKLTMRQMAFSEFLANLTASHTISTGLKNNPFDGSQNCIVLTIILPHVL